MGKPNRVKGNDDVWMPGDDPSAGGFFAAFLAGFNGAKASIDQKPPEEVVVEEATFEDEFPAEDQDMTRDNDDPVREMQSGVMSSPRAAFVAVQSSLALARKVPSRSLSPVMAAGYYETIEGVKYDRDALEAARAAVAGEGDGRVSKADAQEILETLLDGGGVTATEFRTAFFILRDFRFTEGARELFIARLAQA